MSAYSELAKELMKVDPKSSQDRRHDMASRLHTAIVTMLAAGETREDIMLQVRYSFKWWSEHYR